VRYCSEVCQREDWERGHRVACEPMSQAAGKETPSGTTLAQNFACSFLISFLFFLSFSFYFGSFGSPQEGWRCC
jgi:hypothetical protein